MPGNDGYSYKSSGTNSQVSSHSPHPSRSCLFVLQDTLKGIELIRSRATITVPVTTAATPPTATRTTTPTRKSPLFEPFFYVKSNCDKGRLVLLLQPQRKHLPQQWQRWLDLHQPQRPVIVLWQQEVKEQPNEIDQHTSLAGNQSRSGEFL